MAYTSLDMAHKIVRQSYFVDSTNVDTQHPRKRKHSNGDDTLSPMMAMAQELFIDGRRFVQRSSSILRSYPLQVYHSMLPFTPSNSALFRTYRLLHISHVDVISGLEEDWNSTIAVLKGLNLMLCVTFSTDSTRLASGSHDSTIRLWDARAGHEITTLKSCIFG
jgi:WD40 repeat protein